MMESLEGKVRRVTSEVSHIVGCDPVWPDRYEQEKQAAMPSSHRNEECHGRG